MENSSFANAPGSSGRAPSDIDNMIKARAAAMIVAVVLLMLVIASVAIAIVHFSVAIACALIPAALMFLAGSVYSAIITIKINNRIATLGTANGSVSTDNLEPNRGPSLWSRLKSRVTGSSESRASAETSPEGIEAAEAQLPNSLGEQQQEVQSQSRSLWSRLKGGVTGSSESRASAIAATEARGARLPSDSSSTQAPASVAKSTIPPAHSQPNVTDEQNLPKASVAASATSQEVLDNIEYYHELVLKPLSKEEIGLRFTKAQLQFMYGNRQSYMKERSDFPRFVLTEKNGQPQCCLYVDDEIFDIAIGEVRTDALQHNVRAFPCSLGIQPKFLQGVKITTTAKLLAISMSDEGYGQFPSSILYPVTYDKLLDRSIVMETMLGLHLNGSIKLLQFSVELLSGYLAIIKCHYEEDKIGADDLPESRAITFLRSTNGQKFVQDFIEYSEAFHAVVDQNSQVALSDSDRNFLKNLLSAMDEMTKSYADDKAVFESNEGTSTETLRMLYGLKSPYVQFFSQEISYHPCRQANNGLITRFLLDPDFKEVLVGQTIIWVLSAVNEHISTWDESAYDLLLFKAETQNCASNLSVLPVVCAAVPGLVETVLGVVAAKAYQGRISKDDGIEPDISVQQDLPTNELSSDTEQKDIDMLKSIQKLLADKLKENEVPLHVRSLITVQAMLEFIKEGWSEEQLLGQVDKVLQKREEDGCYPDFSECMATVNSMFNSTKPATEGDSPMHPNLSIARLIACDVIATIHKLIGNGRLSAAAVDSVCSVASMQLGKLLVEKGGEIHEQVSSMFYNSTSSGEAQFISACVVDIDISPELQHLSMVLKLGNCKKPVLRSAVSDTSDKVLEAATKVQDVPQHSPKTTLNLEGATVPQVHRIHELQ
ncbi:MAG: hypothetical protein ACTJLL_02060 [Anaplasma sp.]